MAPEAEKQDEAPSGKELTASGESPSAGRTTQEYAAKDSSREERGRGIGGLFASDKAQNLSKAAVETPEHRDDFASSLPSGTAVDKSEAGFPRRKTESYRPMSLKEEVPMASSPNLDAAKAVEIKNDEENEPNWLEVKEEAEPGWLEREVPASVERQEPEEKAEPAAKGLQAHAPVAQPEPKKEDKFEPQELKAKALIEITAPEKEKPFEQSEIGLEGGPEEDDDAAHGSHSLAPVKIRGRKRRKRVRSISQMSTIPSALSGARPSIPPPPGAVAIGASIWIAEQSASSPEASFTSDDHRETHSTSTIKTDPPPVRDVYIPSPAKTDPPPAIKPAELPVVTTNVLPVVKAGARVITGPSAPLAPARVVAGTPASEPVKKPVKGPQYTKGIPKVSSPSSFSQSEDEDFEERETLLEVDEGEPNIPVSSSARIARFVVLGIAAGGLILFGGYQVYRHIFTSSPAQKAETALDERHASHASPRSAPAAEESRGVKSPSGATATAPATSAANAQPPSAATAPQQAKTAEAPAQAASPNVQAEVAQLVQQANAAENAKRHEEAADLYRQILDVDPSNSGALTKLAFYFLNKGKYRRAVDLAYRALSGDPSSAEAWIVLGAAKDSLNDRAGAREAYRNCADMGKGTYAQECRRMLR